MGSDTQITLQALAVPSRWVLAQMALSHLVGQDSGGSHVSPASRRPLPQPLQSTSVAAVQEGGQQPSVLVPLQDAVAQRSTVSTADASTDGVASGEPPSAGASAPRPSTEPPPSSTEASGEGPLSTRPASREGRPSVRSASGEGPLSGRPASGECSPSARPASGKGPPSARPASAEGPPSSGRTRASTPASSLDGSVTPPSRQESSVSDGRMKVRSTALALAKADGSPRRRRPHPERLVVSTSDGSRPRLGRTHMSWSTHEPARVRKLFSDRRYPIPGCACVGAASRCTGPGPHSRSPAGGARCRCSGRTGDRQRGVAAR